MTTEKNDFDVSLLNIRKMFLAALICGALGVCIPQYLQIPWLAVVLPISCMALYVGLGYSYSVESLFLEQFADSVYYMGFLLTLIALVMSLYFYQGDALESGLLVANFSLALLTTIFGLAVRILINNFQVDLESAERHMMNEVEHAASELVRKAKLISMQLEVSQQETHVAIRKTIENAGVGMLQTATTLDEFAESTRAAMQKNMQSVDESIQQTIQQFEANIQEISMPEQVLAEKMSAPLDRLVNRLDEYQVLLNKMNTQQTGIVQNSQGLARSMEISVQGMAGLTETLQRFNEKLDSSISMNADFVDAVEKMSTLAEQTGRVSEQLSHQNEVAVLTTEKLNRLLSSLDVLPTELEQMGGRLTDASRRMINVFEKVGEHTTASQQIGDDLKGIADSLGHSRDAVQQISDFGVHVISSFKRMETFNQMIDEHVRLMGEMGGIAQKDLQMARQQQAEMDQVLRQSREVLAAMQKDMAEQVKPGSGQAIGQNGQS